MNLSSFRARGLSLSFTFGIAYFCACTGTVQRPDGPGGGDDPRAPKSPNSPQPPGPRPEGPVVVDPNAEKGVFDFHGEGFDGLARISSMEYRNILTDVFGAIPAQLSLPDDEGDAAGTGFVGQSFAMTDTAFAAYQTAAETVAAALLDRPLSDKLNCDLAKGDRACVEKFLDTFAARLLRRPLDADGKSQMLGLYDRARTEFTATAREAAALVIARLLLSPQFLHKIEPEAGASSNEPRLVHLDAFALASRLAFFLWRSGPDSELLAAAQSGEILKPEVMASQARRLLADPRAAVVIQAFHAQWLERGHLDEAQREDPRFTEALKTAMATESDKFVKHVVFDGNGGLTDLLTARYSFLTPELAKLYGVPSPRGVDQPTPFDASVKRAGMFGHASFLAGHATERDSNPITRAVTLFERVLCRELPKVPPNVAEMEVEDRLSHPVCGGCHRSFEPLGLGLELYGSLGEERSTTGRKVDGNIADSVEIDGVFTGSEELGRRLLSGVDGPYCYARQWFRFAVGRVEGPLDVSSMNDAVEAFRSAKLDVRELLISVVQTRSFRTRSERPANEQRTCTTSI
ncbi:MAG: DUF1592 domain-containing protein [Deltaproteobacteria bacterium]|nr:DUF1592 domain-containing protein [Deltaproteobacteria bacterium]